MAERLLNMMNEIVNVRSYSEKTIPEEIIDDLLKAFKMGPSSVSTQARELLRVDDRKKRQLIVASTLDPYLTKDSHGSQEWILDVPFLSVVLIEQRWAMARVGEAGIQIATQEAYAAIQNLRIMAKAHSLATACVIEFDQNLLKENLQLPWYTMPVAILTVGYSKQPIDIPPRLSIQQLISKENWE